jgi:2-dehydro-3-deoxy-D-gluconate 5-dehydrogenase
MQLQENLFSLVGKVSMVTGGSRGLGFGMAQGLARAGSKLILVGRDGTQLQEAAKQIRQEAGAEVAPLAWDVSAVDSLGDLVGQAAGIFDRIDVLVNNAGVQVRKPFLEITVPDYNHVLDVNLRAVFFMSQQVARHMVAKYIRGKIINVASLTSRLGIKNTAPYGASKAGVAGLTKNMAVELAEYGIRVNAIAPGYFRTRLTESAFTDSARMTWMQSRIPLGEFGHPNDLAGIAVFLASPASDYLTGDVIFVDGGWASG